MFSTTLSYTILKYYNTLKNALYKNKLTQFLTDHNFTGKILPNKIIIIHLVSARAASILPLLSCAFPFPCLEAPTGHLWCPQPYAHEWHCCKINSNQLFLLLCQPTKSKHASIPAWNAWFIFRLEACTGSRVPERRWRENALVQQRSKPGWGDARNPLKVKPPLARTLQKNS